MQQKGTPCTSHLDDALEVPDDIHSKTACNFERFQSKSLSVRLNGSSKGLHLCKSNIRFRQSWQHGKWVLIRKGSGNRQRLKVNELSTLSGYQNISSQMLQATANTKVQSGNDCFTAENILVSWILVARTLTGARQFCSSDVEDRNRNALK